MAESPARGTSTPVKLFITQFYPDNVAEADVDAVLRAIPVRQWAAHCAARHALTTGHYGGGGSKSRPTGQGGFGTRRIVWYAAPVARDQATTASARSAALALTPDPRIADQRCVIGHSLARYSLLSCGARKPLVIRRGESGKPHLERRDGEAALHFNISHDGGTVVAAVCAASEVGVDVMRCGRRNGGRRGAELAQELSGSFTGTERQLLAPAAVAGPGDSASSPSACDTAFFALWACKEAVLKALGVGLCLPLDRVATELNASHVERVHCSMGGRSAGSVHTPVAVPVRVYDEATPWEGRVCCWAEPGDYVVAVARRDGVLPAVEREDVQVEAALAAAARSADCGT